MIKRKLTEIASGIYRTFVYPVVRCVLELKTKSIMKQHSYLNQGSVLEGRNYIGKNVYLSNVHVGFGSYINNNSIVKNTQIGKYTSIGTDFSCAFGKHPVNQFVAMHPAFYSMSKELGYSYAAKELFEEAEYLDEQKKIQLIIGNDVWIGNHVTVLEGITIGDGAVIGTGAVVTRDVEPYGIYTGVPAKKKKSRFTQEQIATLLKLRWWDCEEAFLQKNWKSFRSYEEIVSLFEQNTTERHG